MRAFRGSRLLLRKNRPAAPAWVSGMLRVVWAGCVFAALVISLGARADRAFITNQKSDSVSVVDLTLGQVVRTLPVGRDPAGIAVSPDAGRVLVTCPGNGEIWFLEGADFLVRAVFRLGDGPLGVSLAPDGRRAYVADFYGHFVSVIDLERAEVIKRVPLGDHPAGRA